MPSFDSIKLTDNVSLEIVAKHQRDIGDKTPGRTLTRIIQAFEHAGIKLVPGDVASAGEPVSQSA